MLKFSVIIKSLNDAGQKANLHWYITNWKQLRVPQLPCTLMVNWINQDAEKEFKKFSSFRVNWTRKEKEIKQVFGNEEKFELEKEKISSTGI